MEIKEIKRGNIRWLDIVHPKQADVNYLAKNFPFHTLDLEDCLSTIQRPKIDEYEDYLFMVLHFPRFFKETSHLVSSEVDFFIGKNYLVTLHNGSQKLLNEFFEKCKDKPEFFTKMTKKGSGFLLYQIINLLYGNCFPMIDKIYEKIEKFDMEIYSEKRHPKLLIKDLSNFRREIINFRRIIKPQREVIGVLEKVKAAFLAKDVDIYFDDIGDQIEKIWDLLENQKEVADSLSTTYEAVVSNKTNDVIKTLTIFSVILLPLTLLSGLFGMNVDLPFSEKTGFIFIIGLMFLITIIMISIFTRKDWL